MRTFTFFSFGLCRDRFSSSPLPSELSFIFFFSFFLFGFLSFSFSFSSSPPLPSPIIRTYISVVLFYHMETLNDRCYVSSLARSAIKKIIRGAAVCIQTLRALRNPPTCHSFAALSVSQGDTALEKTGSRAFSFPLWNNKQVNVEGQGSRGCHSSGLGGGGIGLPSARRVGTLRWPPELRGRAD